MTAVLVLVALAAYLEKGDDSVNIDEDGPEPDSGEAQG